MLLGVPKLLSSLSEHASPMVYIRLASSAGQSLLKIKTNHLPAITKAFSENRRVFGDDTAMAGRPGKPAPAIFLLALERINDQIREDEHGDQEGLITLNECLVFEDSIAGVEAGRKAGMRVIWVPRPQLLEVCRGMEEKVLAGITEEEIDEKRLRQTCHGEAFRGRGKRRRTGGT